MDKITDGLKHDGGKPKQSAEIKRQIEIKNRLLYNLKAVCEEKVGEG